MILQLLNLAVERAYLVLKRANPLQQLCGQRPGIGAASRGGCGRRLAALLHLALKLLHLVLQRQDFVLQRQALLALYRALGLRRTRGKGRAAKRKRGKASEQRRLHRELILWPAG